MSASFEKLSEEPNQTYFEYELISFTNEGLQIKLNFSDPLLISEGEEPDKVHIHLAKDLFLSRNIYDDVDDQNAPPSRLLSTIETRDELIFTVDLPKLLPNLQEGEELESQGDSANKAMTGNFLTSFVAQFFLNSSLSLLWNIFNTL